MSWDEYIWQRFPEWLSAIGTLFAVVVALYLARQDKRIRLVGSASRATIIGASPNKLDEVVSISVTNLGTRQFTLTGIYWVSFFLKRKHYLQFIDANALSSKLPIQLKDGEQATYLIPLKEWVKNAQPELVLGPRFLAFLWSRLIFLQVSTTHGKRYTFRIKKGLHQLIADPGAT